MLSLVFLPRFSSLIRRERIFLDVSNALPILLFVAITINRQTIHVEMYQGFLVWTEFISLKERNSSVDIVFEISLTVIFASPYHTTEAAYSCARVMAWKSDGWCLVGIYNYLSVPLYTCSAISTPAVRMYFGDFYSWGYYIWVNNTG